MNLTYPNDFENKILCGDCLEVMKCIPDDSIDLVVTSPPYNCGIDYDVYIDTLDYSDYKKFAKQWLSEIFRVLKDNGRFALNIPYEVNLHERGGRIFLLSDYWQIMESIGYRWAGLVDLVETQPHRVKYTSWGSYLSASAPYIYNPKECVIVSYKNNWKKGKGINSLNKKEFIEYVSGMWHYEAERRGLTKANFSLDIPMKAVKILSFKNDIVLDPFIGSGTTAVACKELKRKYIGIDISEAYCKMSRQRLSQMRLDEVI